MFKHAAAICPLNDSSLLLFTSSRHFNMTGFAQFQDISIDFNPPQKQIL